MTSCTPLHVNWRRTTVLFALGCCALTLGGCSSKSPQPSDSTDTRTGTQLASQDEWFCQVGASNDDWDCVKGSNRREPTRLPEPRTSGSRSTSATEAAAALATPVPPAGQPGPSATATSPPPAPVTTADEEPPPTNGAAVALPTHVELSYRPDQPVAILDLPENFFAVQLVAVSSKEALEKYARERKLSGMSAARIYADERMYYILLLGIYETRDKADAAIASLTGPLAELDPWIRSVGSLQRAMLEADRVSGTENY